MLPVLSENGLHFRWWIGQSFWKSSAWNWFNSCVNVVKNILLYWFIFKKLTGIFFIVAAWLKMIPYILKIYCILKTSKLLINKKFKRKNHFSVWFVWLFLQILVFCGKNQKYPVYEKNSCFTIGCSFSILCTSGKRGNVDSDSSWKIQFCRDAANGF